MEILLGLIDNDQKFFMDLHYIQELYVYMHLLRILDWNTPKNVQHRIKLELLYELTRLKSCAVSCLRKNNCATPAAEPPFRKRLDWGE